MDGTRLDQDLDAMAGNPRLADTVRDTLQRLRDGHGGRMLAEMADDLLDGRISLKDVAGSSAYSGPLLDGITRYQQWQSELTTEERQLLEAEAHDTYGRDLLSFTEPGDL
ncbi:hypothetical protein FB565_000243 [Actinoplanes lutulentus]|uniref:Uncharacterized protein n=1 Tax=Actinoplanes lutulentus TaxID=1287878 RepID=A0A327YYH6_9ACTN|nr:hypothetical protein [Actinoplanes lutulentus]MBB2940539.1 hypothetical protein [Actinoplanes lutulentus]RAK24809.1 hypothetical protein B0I29_13515 [Actinoplanes lutulentus]